MVFNEFIKIMVCPSLSAFPIYHDGRARLFEHFTLYGSGKIELVSTQYSVANIVIYCFVGNHDFVGLDITNVTDGLPLFQQGANYAV